jgi:hypothetical protein
LRWFFSTALIVAPAGAAPALSSGSVTRSISSGGTTRLQSGPAGVDGLQWPEFAAGDSEEGPHAFDGTIVDRSQSSGTNHGVSVNSGKKAKSNPELKSSFAGLNHRDQRLANRGNQFSLEPPDQGLCVGNGYVMETVNDVLRVFDTAGNPLTGVIDQNTFYGYPAAIVRPSTFGQFITDPSCYFDQQTQRWFHVVLTLDRVGTTSALSGKNHLDLAVSKTSSPLGEWTIYRLPVQDDGTDGTPDHNCPLRNDGTGHGPCLGDYPHIGADANGFYITTNEYAFFPDNIFMSAQIYAFSKSALASGAPNVAVTQFDTVGADNGNPGFTIWPAISPSNQYALDQGGTEYFLSSNAAEEANGTGSSSDLLVWALTNTASLGTSNPALTLSHTTLTVNQYGIPPKSNQKAGDFPLGQCINDTTIISSAWNGPGCWRAFFLPRDQPAHNEVESHLDSNDTRMQQVVYANGKLWGALDTALTLSGTNKAGIAWYIVSPLVASVGVSASVTQQGYLGLTNNNVTYPAIGVTSSGRGVMAFTLVGADHYPSAAYASIDAVAGVGDIHIAKEGLGPSDGFTSYKAFVGNPPRTRWGDYGAAAMDGDSVWIASEYIGQTCTLAQFVTNTTSSPLFSCGRTRTSLGNWGTRISKLTP